MDVIKQYNWIFQYVPENLRNDIDCALIAIRTNSMMCQYVSKYLMMNRHFKSIAIAQNSNTKDYFS